VLPTARPVVVTPFAHGVQAAEPGDEAYVPAGHRVVAVEPAVGANEPIGAAAQFPPEPKKPAWQSVHAAADVLPTALPVVVRPLGQGEQPVARTVPPFETTPQ